LARYDCNISRNKRQLTAVTNPQLYDTPFASPQLEFFVLDDDQWLKVIQRPPFAPRKSKSGPFAKQLLLWGIEFVLYLWLWGLETAASFSGQLSRLLGVLCITA